MVSDTHTRGRPFWRLPLCWLSMCGHRFMSDDTGCWGECVTCGHRAGFVDRATLRRFADAEIALIAQQETQV